MGRLVWTVRETLNHIRPGLWGGGGGKGGCRGRKVPAAYNSKTINDIEMKLGDVVENQKLTNLLWNKLHVSSS